MPLTEARHFFSSKRKGPIGGWVERNEGSQVILESTWVRKSMRGKGPKKKIFILFLKSQWYANGIDPIILDRT